MIVMIEWVNFFILIGAAFLFLYFYVKSVEPAVLEKKIGEIAYAKCSQYRLIAAVFEMVAFINYIVYFFYPLSIPLPRTFTWDWWLSAVVAIVIAIPGGYLWVRGMKDAGEETMIVKKEHTLYGGIYEKIRHPQALGEVTYWWVFAFLLHSPFLALFSFIWIPIFFIMCLIEERDLVIRYGEAYVEYKRNTGFFIPKRKQKRE